MLNYVGNLGLPRNVLEAGLSTCVLLSVSLAANKWLEYCPLTLISQCSLIFQEYARTRAFVDQHVSHPVAHNTHSKATITETKTCTPHLYLHPCQCPTRFITLHQSRRHPILMSAPPLVLVHTLGIALLTVPRHAAEGKSTSFKCWRSRLADL